MNMRRTTGALMIAALALVAGACGSDSKSDASDSKKTTTTTTASGSEETPTTAKPLSDEEFAALIETTTGAITAAGTDFCAVNDATSGAGSVPLPANEAQVKGFVDLYVTLLEALASTLPAENAAQAQTIQAAATAFRGEAEAAGYTVEFINSENGPPSLSSAEFNSAMTEYQTVYDTQCAAATTTTTP